MAGQLYVTTKDGKNNSIENVTDVGVAGSYIIVKFADGSVILEHEGRIDRAHFTPYPQDDAEDIGQGSNDTSG